MTAPEAGDTATVMVDGRPITGTVYYVRENGWPCVTDRNGQCASGPAIDAETLDGMTDGFVLAALWMDAIPLDMGENGETGGLEDREPSDALKETARAICARFLKANADDIAAHMNALGDPSGGHPGEYVGHTFYLASSGHGVSFTDRACSVPLDSTIEAEREKALAALEAAGAMASSELAERIDALDLALALERLNRSARTYGEVEHLCIFELADGTVGL